MHNQEVIVGSYFEIKIEKTQTTKERDTLGYNREKIFNKLQQ